MSAEIAELDVLGIVPYGHEKRHFALRLSHPGWAHWQPGQFTMLRPASFGLELPWGRPFSICHMTGRHLICFFRVQGRGTQRLAQVHPGDTVTAWGPLGRGFVMEENRPTLLLAGGMGMAPFVGYAHRHPQPWNLSMLFGHREPLDCFPMDSINERIPVDTLHEQNPDDLNNFIAALQERMRHCASQGGIALACGPEPFLRTIRSLALDLSCPTQLSLENRMACGVGACLGCVCQTPRNPLPVQTCIHGPVFWAQEVSL